MPLVILTGWPLAGKTTFGHRLKELLSKDFQEIEIVSNEILGVSSYSLQDTAGEKKARAAFLAAVERKVSPERLVIADNCNEIKGFRYQLYCIARAASTPHICIQLLCSESDCLNRNKNLYSAGFIEDVIARYEEPNGQCRWDSPLFFVQPDGTFPYLEEARTALLGQPQKQTSLATRKAEIPADYVQELEAACRRVCDQVQSQGVLCFNVSGKYNLSLSRRPSIIELQKLKRQFVHLNRQTACPTGDIERLFVDYLKKHIDE